jgi:hypothetical protein
MFLESLQDTFEDNQQMTEQELLIVNTLEHWFVVCHCIYAF